MLWVGFNGDRGNGLLGLLDGCLLEWDTEEIDDNRLPSLFVTDIPAEDKVFVVVGGEEGADDAAEEEEGCVTDWSWDMDKSVCDREFIVLDKVFIILGDTDTNDSFD